MNKNIIEKYNVILRKKQIVWEIAGEHEVSTFSSNNKYLDELLNGLSSDDITENLIPEIEKVLSGNESEVESGSETITIILKKNEVDLYDNEGGFRNTIPVVDFKEICLGWLDFLLTPLQS